MIYSNHNKRRPELGHLNDAEITELMELYYSRQLRNSELIRKFRIPINNPGALIWVFPNKIYENLICPYCNRNLESRRLRRSRKNAIHQFLDIPTCPSCRHQDGDCRCYKCRKILFPQEMQINFKASISEESENQDYLKQYQTFDKLDLRDILYIISSQKYFLLSNDSNYVNFDQKTPYLSPNINWTKEIIKSLIQKGLIGHPNITSNLIKKTYKFLPFFRNDVKKNIWLNELEEIIKKKNNWPEIWKVESKGLWQEIAKHECYIDLFLLYKERGLSIAKIEVEILKLYDQLLNNFSVLQILNLNYQTVRTISDDIVKSKIPCSEYNIDIILNELGNKATKAIEKKWKIENYNFKWRPSAISLIFFNNFLEIGEGGREKSPYNMFNKGVSID